MSPFLLRQEHTMFKGYSSFFLRHINSFLLVLLDAFSSRFFNTNVLFLYTLYSSFFFWCLVQSGLFLFLKLAFLCYSSTALAGGYSCVTLTLTLSLYTFHLFRVSSSSFCFFCLARCFLTCHHSITDFDNNAFLNQDSHRLLKFMSDSVSIFDTG